MNMSQSKYLTIDGRNIKIEGERNLLELIRKAKIELPTFCYHSELSIYGACRLCIVEVQGRGVLSACSTVPEEGMAVRTQSPDLQKTRKITIELLLASGKHNCATCNKSDDCKLRDIAYKLGVRDIRFKAPVKDHAIDTSSLALERDQNKCVLCGDCVRACHEIQSIGAIDFAGRGPTTVVTPAYYKPLAHVDCVECGQCARVCPTGALAVRSDIDAVSTALADPQQTVIVQVAPACRTALGEMFGKKAGEDVSGLTVTALRMLGFKQVFDTAFAADLTVLEESSEFLRRKERGEKLPLFTSCCPAWVKFAEQYFPSLLGNISTCRSPQQMFGSLARDYLPRAMGIDRKNMVVVSIMPCTAKKYEAARPEFAADGQRDVDFVLTTQELGQMIKKNGIVFNELTPSGFDQPLGIKTGAGIIFGNSGGVSEAVIRHVARAFAGITPDQLDVSVVRSEAERREMKVVAGSQELRLCIVHGLKNARKVAEEVEAGTSNYDLIEVMSCPHGCIGGAGQPIPANDHIRRERAQGLYHIDSQMELKVSSENTHLPEVAKISLTDAHKSHELLHTRYHPKKRILDEGILLADGSSDRSLKVKVCVGTGCYLRGASSLLHELLAASAKAAWKDQVEISASFCSETCNKGPTVTVGDEVHCQSSTKHILDLIEHKTTGWKEEE
jgi:NADH-quinone oxidoreductase subunit G